MDVEHIVSQSCYSMLEGKIDGKILKSLKEMGIDKPTRIQAEALPHLLGGQDLIGAAKTGSGKTLAFLIPVVDKLIKIKMSASKGNLKFQNFLNYDIISRLSFFKLLQQ